MNSKTCEVKVPKGMRMAIMAPGLLPKELKKLRKQIDRSMRDPSYVIVTNYEFIVTFIPANEEGDKG